MTKELPYASAPSPLTIFVCGPYRAADYGGISGNIEKARQAAIDIAACNVYPFTPHLNTGHFDYAVPHQYPNVFYTEDLYLGGCLHFLSKCDALYLLGDDITDGMRGELNYANQLGLPILTSIKEVQEWKNDLVELGLEEGDDA